MAIAPEYFQQARAEAPIHLQLRLEKRPDHADSSVGGKIVRIFRDDAQRLRRGERIRFDIRWNDSDRARGARDEPPVLGGQRFALDIAWLKAARYLEAYLTPAWRDGRADSAGGFDVVRDQVTALRHTTATPVNPPDREGYGIFVTDEVLRRADARSSRPSWWSKFTRLGAGRNHGR